MTEVVLLDDEGVMIGTAAKAEVHHQETPLHLAFSAYVFNERGELLVTRRASTKRTWPNVWTNSCCGHPEPGEALPDAVRRRLREELGLPARSIDLVLPRFRYQARMPNGVMENELCPVYRVYVDHEPVLEPAEVSAAWWVPWLTFATAVRQGAWRVSPWCFEQVRELGVLPTNPVAWPVAGGDELPRAAWCGE